MRWLMVLFSLAALCFAALTGVQRWRFQQVAVSTIGEVISIDARDSTCGRKPRRQCTKFDAVVEYPIDDAPQRLTVGAGQSRGHRQPLSEAEYRKGDPMPVRYNPQTGEAMQDSGSAIWGLPIVLAIMGGVFMVVGLLAGRRR